MINFIVVLLALFTVGHSWANEHYIFSIICAILSGTILILMYRQGMLLL